MNVRPWRRTSSTAGARERTSTTLLAEAEQVAAALPALLAAGQRVAASVSQGVHGRRQVGVGETFWQYRRYQPGDSLQHVDWRQSGKSDKVYIREMEWEAAQSVWLWQDGSASMRWRGSDDRPEKLARAQLLLLALAALLVRGGERVALLSRDESPATGRSALQRLAVQLQADSEAVLDDAERRTQAGQMDDELSLVPQIPLPRHSRVVLFSDFLAPVDAVATRMAAFARRQVQGHLLQVLDPDEVSLPYDGRVLFAGCEEDGELLFGRVDEIREAYQQAFEQHQTALAETARRYGWSFFSDRTDQPPQLTLLSLWQAVAGPARMRSS